MPDTCACGCRRWVKKGRLWAPGHHLKREGDHIPKPVATDEGRLPARVPATRAAVAMGDEGPDTEHRTPPEPPRYDPRVYPPPGRFFKTGL